MIAMKSLLGLKNKDKSQIIIFLKLSGSPEMVRISKDIYGRVHTAVGQVRSIPHSLLFPAP